MTDLNERLRGIDRLSPHDLWETAQSKARSDVWPPSEPSAAKRFATIAVALALSLAAIAFLIIAFRPAAPVPTPAAPPILSPAPRSDCPRGLVRSAAVSTSEFVSLTEGYLPKWMPEGFGLQATFGLEQAEDGYGAYGIWSDERCRLVEYTFNPNWAASDPGGQDPQASVGPWVVEVDKPAACGNAVLGEARCLRYSTSTTDGLLTLAMMGLDRAEGDRIALSTYAGEAVFFPTTQGGPSGDLALYQGLLIERDGCIFMDGGEQVSLPLWPQGYTVDRGTSGALQIHAVDGAIVAVVGGPISMGGGYTAEFFPLDKVEPRDTQLASVNERLDEPIPQQCLVSNLYGVWLVGGVDVPSS